MYYLKYIDRLFCCNIDTVSSLSQIYEMSYQCRRRHQRMVRLPSHRMCYWLLNVICTTELN